MLIKLTPGSVCLSQFVGSSDKERKTTNRNKKRSLNKLPSNLTDGL